jgi:arylsulfatase A-like enzyme
MQRPDGSDFLLIIADQLRHDQLGCRGDGFFQTPTLDALAARGVLRWNRLVSRRSQQKHPPP